MGLTSTLDSKVFVDVVTKLIIEDIESFRIVLIGSSGYLKGINISTMLSFHNKKGSLELLLLKS
jgi:hypothetical protein